MLFQLTTRPPTTAMVEAAMEAATDITIRQAQQAPAQAQAQHFPEEAVIMVEAATDSAGLETGRPETEGAARLT